MSIIAGAAPGPSSRWSNVRPTTAPSPMTSKKLPVTMPAWTCTGSPAPMRLKVSDENSATAASDRAWLPDVHDLGDRERGVLLPGAGGRLLEVEQPVAALVRQRAEQHPAEHAEDRGIGADAECQGEDDGEGEARGVDERAQGVAHGCSWRSGTDLNPDGGAPRQDSINPFLSP